MKKYTLILPILFRQNRQNCTPLKYLAFEVDSMFFGVKQFQMLKAIAEKYGKSPYGQHLKNVAAGKLAY